MGIALSAVARLQSPLYNVQKADKKAPQSSEKLATGKSVNRASDDVVSLVKAVSLEVESRGLDTINQYASYKNNMLAIEDGNLSENLEQLQNLHELAIRSADDSLSSSEREVLNSQANDIAPTDLSTPTSANEALDHLNASINQLASQREQLGSQSNVLETRINANQSEQVQIEKALSVIQDTDVAKVKSQQIQNQLQMNLAISVLKRSQQIESNQALRIVA